MPTVSATTLKLMAPTLMMFLCMVIPSCIVRRCYPYLRQRLLLRFSCAWTWPKRRRSALDDHLTQSAEGGRDRGALLYVACSSQREAEEATAAPLKNNPRGRAKRPVRSCFLPVLEAPLRSSGHHSQGWKRQAEVEDGHHPQAL